MKTTDIGFEKFPMDFETDVNITFIKQPIIIKQEPYVGDDGIYMPYNEYVPEGCETKYKCILTKEMFIEAYNKWIKGE